MGKLILSNLKPKGHEEKELSLTHELKKKICSAKDNKENSKTQDRKKFKTYRRLLVV